ncbi:hypothetical protein SAMN06265173_15116 [Thalassovita litoralis]|uniref:Uncharacterized protein n=1 Tax=Thalassovita litoralis TaxID=1010611 RepID=A0A521FSU5_9RHOB|nr:hypothetical protein [Thalassovita litoralis]SMO99229.1 hypothetical protein SAMN06265173_15116 [Thalassovita litoralis]
MQGEVFLLLSSFLRRNVDIYRIATSLTPKQKSDLFVLIDAVLVIFSLALAALLFGVKFDSYHTLKGGVYIGIFLAALGSGPINRLEIALVACFKSPNFQGVS